MTADISVLIVAWNTREILLTALDALWSGSRARLEVIVVDNASADEGMEALASRFGGRPDLTVLSNPENVGFPRAANQALSHASAPYVLLMNPDIVFLPGALDRLLAFLKAHPEVGAVGPKVRYPDGRIQLHCARRLPRVLDFLASRFGLSGLLPRLGYQNGLMSDWDHEDSREVECLLGAAILMRTDDLKRLRGLVEEMYLEDLELCWQVAHVLGKKVYYLAETETVHHHHASFQAISDLRQYLRVGEQLESASLKFLARHAGRPAIILARLGQVTSGLLKTIVLLVAVALLAWCRPMREHSLRALCRAYARLVTGLRKMTTTEAA